MKAGVETADVAQIPGDVGVDGLPVGIAVELRHAAHLLVEQLGGRDVEHGIVGNELPGGVLARFGRAVDRLVHGLAQRVELHVQIVDAGAYRRGVVEAARQVLAHRVHLVACAIGIFAHLLVELLTDRGVHRRRSVEDVGGKAALGIHVARDFADRAHHFQPALCDRDLVHGLIFGSRHIDGEPAADGGKRDDGSGEEGTDFHGILAICAGAGVRATSISGAN